MKKTKNLKDLTQEINQIEAKLKEIKTEQPKFKTEIEYLEDAIAEEKGKITTANINIKNFTARRLKSRRERNKLVREEKILEQTEKAKKKQLDKAKEEFFDTMKEKKDFTTEKYGPDYLQDLGGLLIENGNGHDKKKEVKKDESNENK
jgi:chromosome segregation ATPase